MKILIWTVFRKKKSKYILETLSDAAEEDLLDELNRITSDKEWAENAPIKESVIAGYIPSERAIYFNPDRFSKDTIEQKHEEGWFVADSIEGSTYHELGHHQHFENMRESVVSTKHLMEHIEEEGIPSEIEHQVGESISEYATKVQPYEFVAEIFAMKRMGEEIDPELEHYYQEIINPEI